MTSSKDSEIAGTGTDTEQLRTLMKTTGLPEPVVAEMLRSDQDLDELCDTVLSMFATDNKKVAITKR